MDWILSSSFDSVGNEQCRKYAEQSGFPSSRLFCLDTEERGAGPPELCVYWHWVGSVALGLGSTEHSRVTSRQCGAEFEDIPHRLLQYLFDRFPPRSVNPVGLGFMMAAQILPRTHIIILFARVRRGGSFGETSPGDGRAFQ